MVYPSSTMQSDWDGGKRDLDAQLARKEREWKELQAARVDQLKSSLKKAQEECSTLRERHQLMKDDFQFNLAILDERDRELERYDVITARALTVEHNRQEELKQLRMQVARLEELRAREAEERQEELSESRHDAAQHRVQLDELKLAMAAAMQKQTEKHELMKWNLQCRIQELERELTLQRQEMTAAFDSELKQREQEFNLNMNEMRAVVLSCDHKNKLLCKEAEVHCQAQQQATEALKASEEFCQQMQTQLRHKGQEIKDLTAVKDYRIKELEDELKWMDSKLKKEEDEHIKKYEDVIRALNECDAQLKAQYQAHIKQLQKAEKRIVKLQETMDILAAQTRCLQKDQQEAMRQKDETIQRLHTEVESTRTGWDKYISQVSSEMVVKDTETITLQERESKLRSELERSREEMKKYKEQLSAGLKRERALEQRRVQLELEWQRRCEDVKAEHYLANEHLIQDLTKARDQANAELKEKEQELKDMAVLLCSVKTERDQAIQGLTPRVDSLASEEIHRLQEQNSILRAVITQMRKDMESLSHLLPHNQNQPPTSSPQPVQRPAATSTLSTTDTQMPTVATGTLAESTHLSSKVNPAGCLCLEKHADASAFTEQEVSVAHRESALTNIKEQRALVRQPQEKNLHLRRRQPTGLMSGGLFANVQGAKSNPSLLHTRLKQAAMCITRLTIEKQQLIEMGNRLRTQITTAGLQEQVEPKRDSSTEKPGDQHNRLCAVEQLQYQLTTQELQYALRQKACTLAEQLPPGTSSQGPATNGAANPCCQGHKTTDRPKSSNSGLSRSQLSSEESLRSLKELWEVLDHGLSQSVFSEGESELNRREVAEPGSDGVRMMVHGFIAPIHSHPPTEGQQKRPSTKPSNITKTSRSGALGSISKIRNYNLKD